MSDCLWNHFTCKAWNTSLWVFIPLPKAVEMPGQHIQKGLGLGLFPSLGVWFGVLEKSLIQRVHFQLDTCSERSCIFIYAVCVPMHWALWAVTLISTVNVPTEWHQNPRFQILYFGGTWAQMSHLICPIMMSSSTRSPPRPQLLPFRRNSIIYLSILHGS